MQRNTRPVTVCALTAVALLLAACGGARGGGSAGSGDSGKPIVLKFSHVTATSTPKGQAAAKFEELLEEKSGGRIDVQVFPNSELYGDKDEFQALQSNSVQMLAPASSKFTTVAPKLQVLDLPFLFDTAEDIPKVVAADTAVGKAIFTNPKLAAKNIKVLGLWDNGFKQLSSNTPMRTPADLRGLRFRIQPSDVLRSQFEAWGAQPTPMAFAEVYNAMQQGVIDGGENTYSNIESQKMHTVQKHITELSHGYLGYILVVNPEFYDSLPSDLQKAVDEAAAEASAFNRQVAGEVNQASKKKIEAAGTTTILVPSAEQRAAFKASVVPSVWDQYRNLIGSDLIDELLKSQS